MKHCLKTNPEPTGIATFRQAKPQATWDQFKNENREGCAEIVIQLRQDQRGLCAFCELALSESNLQVGHFHPKSDTASSVNWALTWTNLWLCCKGGTQTWHTDIEEYVPPLPQNRSCDESKEDLILDGIILEPNEVPPFPRIFGYLQQPNAVELVVDATNCAEANVDPSLASNTIMHLNLNCPRLTSARLTVLRMIERDVEAARKAGGKDLTSSNIPAKWLSQQPGGHYRKFFTLIRWRLKESAEQHLQSVGYEG